MAKANLAATNVLAALGSLSNKTLDELITETVALRDEAKALNEEFERVKAKQREMEKIIIKRMESQGIEKMGNKSANASISEIVQPKITDWEKVTDYVVKNNATYLLYKQISATAYRELLNSGETVPGLEPFDLKKLSLRKPT